MRQVCVGVEKDEDVRARSSGSAVELRTPSGSTFYDKCTQGFGDGYRTVVAAAVTDDDFVGNTHQFRQQSLDRVLFVERWHNRRNGDGRQSGGMLA